MGGPSRSKTRFSVMVDILNFFFEDIFEGGDYFVNVFLGGYAFQFFFQLILILFHADDDGREALVSVVRREVSLREIGYASHHGQDEDWGFWVGGQRSGVVFEDYGFPTDDLVGFQSDFEIWFVLFGFFGFVSATKHF